MSAAYKELAQMINPYNYLHRLKRLKHMVHSFRDLVAACCENISGRGKQHTSLVILDDIYPHLLSAFRIAEYNHYLGEIADSEVHSTFGTASSIGEKRSFSDVVEEYERHYPQFKGRVTRFNRFRPPRCKLLYLIFLNNTYHFIKYIERSGTPFVFTLYPGGGFHLHQEGSDAKLRRVLSSPCFRKVIVTQTVSYQYLIENHFCTPEQVEFVYGGVLPSGKLQVQEVFKKYYKKDKNTFDICFVAQKYKERGVDKGYDAFIEVAKELCRWHADIFFHIIGPYDPTDMDVSELDGRIRFYGSRKTKFFPEFYSGMDIILSPNVPFVLAPGSFDGFPTGCCVEAGLSGVAVFCTDCLKLNFSFKDREEIVIIPPDISEITHTVMEYFQNPGKLYELSDKCKAAFARVFDIENQMSPRLKVLTHYLNSPE